MADTPQGRSPNTSAAQQGWTWKRLLTVATIAAVVGLAVLFFLAGVIPPLLLFGVLLIVGVVLLRSRTKPAAILLLIVHLAMFALSLPFTIPSLMVPASAYDFSLTLYLAVLNLVGLAAAVQVLRGQVDETSGAARWTASAALAVIVLGIVLAVFSTVTYDNAVAQEGDIRLITEDTNFSASNLETSAGTVSVFVDNKDATTHTFTIEELDVDLEIPGGKQARVTFDAEPGTYQYICVPHEEDMGGALVAE